MKIALIYGKFVASTVVFVAVALFARHINDKLLSVISTTERVVLLSLVIAGAVSLIAHLNQYMSERLFPSDR